MSSGEEDNGDLQFSFEEELVPELGQKKVSSVPVDKFANDRKIFIEFLKSHTCYETIPASGKIVVLDSALAVKSAFRALIENQIKSAPLWGSDKGEYIGMITVTDFINIILRHYHSLQDKNMQIFSQDDYQIRTWRDTSNQPTELVYSHPNDTVYDSALLLLQKRIHRIPIIDKDDDNSILHFISHHRIFVFMINNLKTSPDLLNKSIKELGIGTFNNVVTVFKDTRLVVVLNLLVERHISSVPVVDETGVVQNTYSKSDAVSLASHTDIFSELDKPIQEFTDDNQEVFTCKRDDTLKKVLTETMLNGIIRQVICVDSTKRVVGIISLSDIMKFIFMEEMKN